MLRHVDQASATVWVETATPCTVEVVAGDVVGSAPTFEVSGHHYALVVLIGLQPATSVPYQVRLDGRQVWPAPESQLPPSRIRTLDGGRFRLLFGSCRRPRREPKVGPDALVEYARRMSAQPEQEWPQALLLLGDQVYADETTAETREWMSSRRDTSEPPGFEVAEFEEYAHLYHEAWSERLVRWLLSTVPTSMIFDDHDVRDDWNTSQTWREQMAATSWWPDRLRGALVSYWVYQHIGNLGPTELAADEVFNKVTSSGVDNSELLREFADRADTEPNSARWSYRRDFGRVRLLMIDTRAGRVLHDGIRSMLDDEEFAWLEENADGEMDHLLIGSSLPWLMPNVISNLQAINEVACERSGLRGRVAESIRQAIDLEHWPAFRKSFGWLTQLIRSVASKQDAPATISVLSGDVHHSYVASAAYPEPLNSEVHQLTCSPMHNKAAAYLAAAFSAGWWRWLAHPTRLLARRAGVERVPVEWACTAGPYFGNTIATLELSGREAEVRFERAVGEALELTGSHRL